MTVYSCSSYLVLGIYKANSPRFKDMSYQLRALLFDSSQADEMEFTKSVFSAWDAGYGVSVIADTDPQTIVDQSIVRIDPTHVISPDGSRHERTSAINDTPGIAAVVLTSGTTGNPLPVELSFGALESSARSLYDVTSLSADDTWLCCLPPYYIAGLAVLSRCWITGSNLIFHSRFDVERIAHDLPRASAISLVAPQLRQLIDHNIDLSHLSTVLVGGSSFPGDLRQACIEKNINVHATYGMTETCGGICHDGNLFDNTQVRIDNDEILVKSDSLFSGYRHNPIATQKKFRDGWFITGDRGVMTDRLSVWGRSDDIINSGGVKVDPLIIEQAIAHLYPENEICVVATEHPTLHESTTLISTTKDINLEQLRSELKEYLPSTHLPIRLGYVKKISRTERGKVNRAATAHNATLIAEHEI